MARICIDCGQSSDAVKWTRSRDGRPSKRRCVACHGRRARRTGLPRVKMRQRHESFMQLSEWGHRFGCVDCGTQLPAVVMQYDHVDVTTKRANVADLHNGAFSTIILEISKCESVCPLCHAFRTDMERLARGLRTFQTSYRRVLVEAVVG